MTTSDVLPAWRLGVTLAAALLFLPALAAAVQAQTVSDVFVNALSNGCQGLQGPSGSYGPRLGVICGGGLPSGAAGTASLSIDTRGED